MSLMLIEHTDPRLFHDAVIERLLQSEAECCVPIGLVRRMARDGYSPLSADDRDQPILWTIQEGQNIDLIAIQTLKKLMNITRGTVSAMKYLADALVRSNWTASSVIGVTPSIESLVQRYAMLSRKQPALVVRLRVFQLEHVIWPAPIQGSMRICRPEDRELLAWYLAGFATDIGEPSQEDTLARADRAIADGRIFFWTDPEPVAMAGWAGPTPNGIRINSVYTSPEFRKRGYASNLVAQLSQHLLDQGRKFCFLFTDQANPTSNSIYQKIGYRPVSDSERWEFHQDHV